MRVMEPMYNTPIGTQITELTAEFWIQDMNVLTCFMHQAING